MSRRDGNHIPQTAGGYDVIPILRVGHPEGWVEQLPGESEDMVMRRGQPVRLLLLLLVTLVAMTVCRTEAQTADATAPVPPQADREIPASIRPDMAPPDLYVRTLLVRDELELIRLEMGKPKDTRRALGVTEAGPREVYFQALTLFRKANRLSFELTRERAALPEKPIGAIRAVHVGAMLDAALQRLQRVKATLRSFEQSPARAREPSKTASDVFRSIVQANRQMNLLLNQQFVPSDVFQQVTLAVGYAAQLLTRFPDTRMPEAPAFERRKRPADVYHRLVECFTRVRTIMTHSELNVLQLHAHPDEATPSDVYDIASLIVSELSFLHAHLDGVLTPPDTYYPGRKYPADVYQRAGLLQALLRDLQALVERHPMWLYAEAETE